MTDKYAHLKPEVKRYRHTCCWSRLGKVKQRFQSRAEAKEAIRVGVGDPQEIYECQTHPGTFHLRHKRS